MKALSIVLSLSAALASSTAFAQTVTIQAEEPGSSIYLYAGLFESVIEGNTDVDVDIVPRGGSVTNTAMVSAGRADFGFSNALPIVWGWNGILDFEGRPQQDNRLIFSGMQVAYLVAAAANDYVESTGNDSISAALAGENPAKFLVEPAGSINPVVLDLYLQANGSSLEDMLASGAVAQVPSSQMGQRAQDGFANGYFGQGPIGNPDLTEIMLAKPMTILSWDESDIEALMEYGFVTAELPAGAFEGQDEAMQLPAAFNNMIVNKDVDEEVVYQVTKAIIENLDQLVAANSAYRDWDPEAYIQPQYQIIPLHPGAERYYRERGWID